MIKLSSNEQHQWKIIRHMKSFDTSALEACLEHGYPSKFGTEIDNLPKPAVDAIFASLEGKYGEAMTNNKTESTFVTLLNRHGFFEDAKPNINFTSFRIGDQVKFGDQIGKVISIKESYVTVRDTNGHVEVFHNQMLEHCGHCHEDEEKGKESKEHKEKPISPNSDDHEDKEENMITEKNPPLTPAQIRQQEMQQKNDRLRALRLGKEFGDKKSAAVKGMAAPLDPETERFLAKGGSIKKLSPSRRSRSEAEMADLQKLDISDNPNKHIEPRGMHPVEKNRAENRYTEHGGGGYNGPSHDEGVLSSRRIKRESISGINLQKIKNT